MLEDCELCHKGTYMPQNPLLEQCTDEECTNTRFKLLQGLDEVKKQADRQRRDQDEQVSYARMRWLFKRADLLSLDSNKVTNEYQITCRACNKTKNVRSSQKNNMSCSPECHAQLIKNRYKYRGQVTVKRNKPVLHKIVFKQTGKWIDMTFKKRSHRICEICGETDKVSYAMRKSTLCDKDSCIRAKREKIKRVAQIYYMEHGRSATAGELKKLLKQ